MRNSLWALACGLIILTACDAPHQPSQGLSNSNQNGFELGSQLSPASGLFKDFPHIHVPEHTPLYQSYFYFKGKRFTSAKLLNKQQQIVQRILDEQGKTYSREEFQTLFSAPQQGKIESELVEAMAQKPAGRLLVLVVFNLPALPILEKPESGNGQQAMQALMAEHEKNLAALLQKKQQYITEIEFQPNERLENLERGPAVLAELSPERIRELEKHPAVLELGYFPPDGKDLLAQTIELTQAKDVHYGGDRYQGKGIKVAVWERGCPTQTAVPLVNIRSQKQGYQWNDGTLSHFDFFNLCEPLTPSDRPPISLKAANSQSHATKVATIIANHGTPAGIAPQVGLLAANTYSLGGLDWALQSGANVVNQSFEYWFLDGRPSERAVASSRDRYVDLQLLFPPYALLAQAAGNDGFQSGTYVIHKGYNGISVGATNHTQTEMADFSSARNPRSIHGDRELPHLVTSIPLWGQGTSMAAPVVAGGAALLQGVDPLLTLWPTGVKALLMAGAVKNIEVHPAFAIDNLAIINSGNGSVTPLYDPRMASGTWFEDLRARKDGFDGAGAIQLFESMQIAQQKWQGQPLFEGWDVGKITAKSFGGEKQDFERVYQIPALPSAQKIRVALDWAHTTGLFMFPHPVSQPEYLNYDLDLLVKNSSGAVVAYSTSFDNNYEIIDFQGEAGESYTIHIHQGETPATILGKENFTWFGIAWNLHTSGMKSTPVAYPDRLAVCQPDTKELLRMKADGSEKYPLLKQTDCSRIRWSPSASQIAIVNRRQTRLSVLDTGMPDSIERVLLSEPSLSIQPFSQILWSPDGKWIAFIAETQNRPNSRYIYVIRADGSMAAPRVLRSTLLEPVNRFDTSGPQGLKFQWHSNSEEIFYLNQNHLHRVNIETQDSQEILRDLDTDQFSYDPQHQRLAFISKRELYVYDLLNQKLEAQEMQNYRSVLQELGPAPSALWSPDGTKIAFLAANLDTRLFSYDVARKKLQPVSERVRNIYDYVWSPDSLSFVALVVRSNSTSPSLFHISADTGSLNLLEDISGGDVDWSLTDQNLR